MSRRTTLDGEHNMKRILFSLVLLVLLAVAAGAGYWWGAWQAPSGTSVVEPAVAKALARQTEGKKKILYYRNAMGLPDTSPVPKKDPMGMDYVPVYEGGEPTPGGPVVKINPDKVQKLGVRTENAGLRALTRTVPAGA